MNEDSTNKELFEQMPVFSAIRILMIPTILGALVTVLYSLADTLFVGMLNNEVESAAVALAAPMLLAFNAVNNLFGVGTSSMMSRALGTGDVKTVRESAAFGFYGAIFSGALLSILCAAFFESAGFFAGSGCRYNGGNYLLYAMGRSVWRNTYHTKCGISLSGTI